MGYYSQVAVAIRKSNETVVKQFDEVNEKYKTFTREEATAYGGVEIVLYRANTKWYEHAPDGYQYVKDYMAVINGDESGDIDYIRVGESDDDVENNASNCWIGTETRICVI